MKMFIVENKRDHIVCLPNVRKRITVRLVPGPNKVTEVAWDAVKDYPSVQARMDDGWIQVVDQVEEAVDVKSFLDLNAARARKAAREMTLDGGTIKAWLAVEKRPSVARELTERMKGMENGG